MDIALKSCIKVCNKINKVKEVEGRPGDDRASQSDLNLIEILLTILKHEIYKNERQFGSKKTFNKVTPARGSKGYHDLQKPPASSLYRFYVD